MGFGAKDFCQKRLPRNTCFLMGWTHSEKSWACKKCMQLGPSLSWAVQGDPHFRVVPLLAGDLSPACELHCRPIESIDHQLSGFGPWEVSS